MSKHTRRQIFSKLAAGFSMIELVVVIFIIAVIAAFGLPNLMAYMRTSQIRSAAQSVAGEIQTARAKAVARNTNNGVLFVPGYPTANQFQVLVEDNPAAPGTRPTIPIAPATGPPNGSIRTLPTGIEFVAASGTGTWEGSAIRFDRLGRACVTDPATTTCPAPNAAAAPSHFVPTAAPTVITLRQPSTGLQRTITIEPGGAIRLQP